MTTDDAAEFARTATLTDVTDAVAEQIRVRVLDTLAAITAGYRMPDTEVVRGYALDYHDGQAATVLDGTGRTCTLAGATLANATAANALDIDDGHRAVKGHPAAVVIPPALAAAEVTDATVGAFCDAVLIGYELAVRAGLAIHATDGVYTGTGSWGAVGAAAAVARIRGLSTERTADAIGTAEYHAPRTPIMRGVEQPGMTKDGIGWGAHAGAVAVDLADRGFTASGTVFDEADVTSTATLGERYQATEGYLKPYPCCRWSHPGIDAVLDLRERHGIDPSTVETIRVHTFTEATHLDTRTPDSVQAAEYSYPYPVGAALARGRFTAAELRSDARTCEDVARLVDSVELTVDPAIDARFPEECLARVELETEADTYVSDLTRPRGARERPLDSEAHDRKLERLCGPTIDEEELNRIRETITKRETPIRELLDPWR